MQFLMLVVRCYICVANRWGGLEIVPKIYDENKF